MSHWAGFLRIYFDRRIAVIFLLGFSSGLPAPLDFANLVIRLSDSGFSRTSNGLFALATLAFAVNFLWAPLVDRMGIRFLTPWLGQRRAWALASQFVLMAAIVWMGVLDPTSQLVWFAAATVAVSFASATQDVVIDAYRIEILEPEKYAAGAAAAVFGWHVGASVVGGAGGLYLVASFDWNVSYFVMAGMVSVGIITVLLCREPRREFSPELVAWEAAAADRIGQKLTSEFLRALAIKFHNAATAPFADFFRRGAGIAIVILGFIVFYKLGDALLGRMAGVFYRELGFSHTDIADVAKLYGVVALIIGGLLGGILAGRFGLFRALLISGILMAATNLMFSWLATAGKDQAVFIIAVVSDNLTAGMATTTFVAYLSSLCNVAYTATQYALLASLGNLARILYAAASGFMVDRLGGDWALFFVITALAAIPGLLILLWLMRNFPPSITSPR